MEQFKAGHLDTDDNGREYTWAIELSVGIVRKLKKFGLDLLSEEPENELLKLHADPNMQLDVLWTLVAFQAKDRNIKQDQFEDWLVGEVLNDALDAIRNETANFTMSLFPDRANLIKESLSSLEKMGSVVLEALTETIDEQKETLKARAKSEMTKAIQQEPIGKKSGSVPE